MTTTTLADGRFVYVDGAKQHVHVEQAHMPGTFTLLHGGMVLACAYSTPLACMALLCPSEAATGASGLVHTDDARTVVHVYRCAYDKVENDDVLTDLVASVETRAATTLLWVDGGDGSSNNSNNNNNNNSRSRGRRQAQHRHFLVVSNARAAMTVVFEYYAHKTGTTALRRVADDTCVHPCVVLGYLALYDTHAHRVLLWSLTRNAMVASCDVAVAAAASRSDTHRRARRALTTSPPQQQQQPSPCVGMCATASYVLTLHADATVCVVHVVTRASCTCVLLQPPLTEFAAHTSPPPPSSSSQQQQLKWAREGGADNVARQRAMQQLQLQQQQRYDGVATSCHIAAAAVTATMSGQQQQLYVGVSMLTANNNNSSSSSDTSNESNHVLTRIVLYMIETRRPPRRAGGNVGGDVQLVAMQTVTLPSSTRLLALTPQRALLHRDNNNNKEGGGGDGGVACAHDKQRCANGGTRDGAYYVMQLYTETGTSHTRGADALAVVAAAAKTTTTTTTHADAAMAANDASLDSKRSHAVARMTLSDTVIVAAVAAALYAYARWRCTRR